MSNYEILTVEEAATFLRISRRTLEYMRHDGRSPKFIKLTGRRIVYRRTDLDAWLTAHTEQRVAA